MQIEFDAPCDASTHAAIGEHQRAVMRHLLQDDEWELVRDGPTRAERRWVDVTSEQTKPRRVRCFRITRQVAPPPHAVHALLSDMTGGAEWDPTYVDARRVEAYDNGDAVWLFYNQFLPGAPHEQVFLVSEEPWRDGHLVASGSVRHAACPPQPRRFEHHLYGHAVQPHDGGTKLTVVQTTPEGALPEWFLNWLTIPGYRRVLRAIEAGAAARA